VRASLPPSKKFSHHFLVRITARTNKQTNKKKQHNINCADVVAPTQQQKKKKKKETLMVSIKITNVEGMKSILFERHRCRGAKVDGG
jgi:hypothetical protein